MPFFSGLEVQKFAQTCVVCSGSVMPINFNIESGDAQLVPSASLIVQTIVLYGAKCKVSSVITIVTSFIFATQVVTNRPSWQLSSLAPALFVSNAAVGCYRAFPTDPRLSGSSHGVTSTSQETRDLSHMVTPERLAPGPKPKGN